MNSVAVDELDCSHAFAFKTLQLCPDYVQNIAMCQENPLKVKAYRLRLFFGRFLELDDGPLYVTFSDSIRLSRPLVDDWACVVRASEKKQMHLTCI